MECAVLAEAGVIDENVDDEPGAFGGAIDVLGREWIVQVRDHDAGFNVLRGELGGERFKALPAPRGEDEFCAPPRKLARQSHTDSRAGSGHQRPFALKFRRRRHRSNMIKDGRNRTQDAGPQGLKPMSILPQFWHDESCALTLRATLAEIFRSLWRLAIQRHGMYATMASLWAAQGPEPELAAGSWKASEYK